MTKLRQAAAGLFALLCLTAGARVPDATVSFVPLTKPMRLALPVRPAKSGSAVYLVKLKEPGAASYRAGGRPISAMPSDIRPANGLRGTAAEAYAERLEQSHDRLLADVGAAGSKLYGLRYASNGFAARLTAVEHRLQRG